MGGLMYAAPCRCRPAVGIACENTMRIGTKMAPVPGVNGTATSTREPSGYWFRLRKLIPPFDKSSQTTTSSAKPRRRLLGLVRRGKVNVPEVAAWLENVDSVQKTAGVLVDFGDHAGPRLFPLIVLQVPPQMQFLAALQLFRETQNAPVAADEK